MEFQKYINPVQNVDTRMAVVEKPDVVSPLLERVAQNERNKALGRKAASEDELKVLQSSALSGAIFERNALMQEQRDDLQAAEDIAAQNAQIFADGVVSPEEAKALKEIEQKLGTIRNLNNPFKRASAMHALQTKYLHPDNTKGFSDSTLKAMDDALGIQYADKAAVDRYGKDLYDAVQAKNPNATAFDYILEARRRSISDNMKFQIEQGSASARTITANIINMTQTRFTQGMQDMAAQYNRIGAIEAGDLNTAIIGLNEVYDGARAEADKAIKLAMDRGEQIDATEIYSTLQTNFDKQMELIQNYGKDKVLRSRLKEVSELFSTMPNLIANVDMQLVIDVYSKAGYPSANIINMLKSKDPKTIQTILGKANMPVSGPEVLATYQERIFRGLQALTTMSVDDVPDPADRKLLQYLAGNLANTTNPPPAVPKTMNRMLKDEKITGNVAKALATNPKHTENVLADPVMSEELKLIVRDNIMRFMEEYKMVNAPLAEGGYGGQVAVRPDGIPRTTAAGQGTAKEAEFRMANAKFLEDTAAWDKYLNSSAARKLLGDELLNKFNAWKQGRDVVDGVTTLNTEDVNSFLPKMGTASDAELQDFDARLGTSLFRAKPGSPEYLMLKQAQKAVLMEQSRRKEPEAKKPQAWKPPHPDVTKANQAKYDPLIDAAAEEFDVDPVLAKAVALQESKYDERARSAAGAMGLMQLMKGTGAQMGLKSEEDFFDPEKNIRAGVQYLAELGTAFFREGSVPEPQRREMIIAAYNAGPGTVRDALKAAKGDWNKAKAELPGQTQEYIKRVLG